VDDASAATGNQYVEKVKESLKDQDKQLQSSMIKCSYNVKNHTSKNIIVISNMCKA
jgi:hypothetical protein